jgi:hypothetical protein
MSVSVGCPPLMTAYGQSRRSDLGRAASGLPLSGDIDAPTGLVRFVPIPEVICQKADFMDDEGKQP